MLHYPSWVLCSFRARARRQRRPQPQRVKPRSRPRHLLLARGQRQQRRTWALAAIDCQSRSRLRLSQAWPFEGCLRIEQQVKCNRPQVGGYIRDALRIFLLKALRFGLALPRPDSLQARLPEAFRHCEDPLVSRPLYCGQSRGFLSLECAPFALC